MKKVFAIISTFILLTNCSDKPKDLGTISKTVGTLKADTIKFFYKSDSVEVWSFSDDPYPDTAIFFKTYIYDIFDFKSDERIVNVYYDKSFTKLAATSLLIKDGKLEHYKRFDRKGNVRMELHHKNYKDSGPNFAWYSNGNFKFKQLFSGDKKLSDTTYSYTGELKTTTTYANSYSFKETTYFKNGEVSSELIYQIPKNDDPDYKIHNPKLRIEYDSVTRFPSLFYLKTVIEVTTDKEGNEITTSRWEKFPVDSSTIKKTVK